MLEAINVHLEARGIRIAMGTIVDATIIHAPSSARNKSGSATRRCTTAASVADKHMLPDLLHGEECKVWGDGGYQGQTEAIQEAAPHAQDMTCRRTTFKNYIDEEAKRKNNQGESRTCVPHPETRLRLDRVRYRSIAKNHHRFCANFALIKLYQHRKRLAVLGV